MGWRTHRFAVAAANPLATEAGHRILKAGGSAVDAAIAVQMVLTLVEPQSSGIGGGAFLLHFDGAAVQTYDGREVAPARVTEDLFLRNGQPLPFNEAMVGGRSVGVPGLVRMLEMAHQRHGILPWADLFQPAIDLAERGFPVSPRLHTLLTQDRWLRQDAVAAGYFYDANGQPWPVGHQLRNPELAWVLQLIARDGARALHEGLIARAIEAKVQNHPSNPGVLRHADLAQYQAKERAPLCHDHATRQRVLRICGFPPPSSGAIAIGQILGILAHTPAAKPSLSSGLPSEEWLHFYTEASKLAFADRALYVADPDFVQAPAGDWDSLLDPSYLEQRSRLIGPRAMKAAAPGQPATFKSAYAPMPHQTEHGTSHISIVDTHGRAVSMTSSIESAFGSRQMVTTHPERSGGFLLNNQLTDFSFTPTGPSGQPVANRVQPGKRPRSSMAPTLVFDKHTGQLLMSAGSPGGAFIIHFTAKTLYGALNGGLDVQQAINLPNFGTLGGPLLLEEQRFPPDTVTALQQRGHTVQETAMPSGLQAIQRIPTGYFGGADPRREGVVMGD